VRFTVQGEYQLISCPSGGWLVKAAETAFPSYWIPQAPLLRVFDASGRILSEKSTAIAGFEATSTNLAIEIKTSGNMQLDLALWRLPPGNAGIVAELERPLVLEKQPAFLWKSFHMASQVEDLFRTRRLRTLCPVEGT
jgi:hypothetical protein